MSCVTLTYTIAGVNQHERMEKNARGYIDPNMLMMASMLAMLIILKDVSRKLLFETSVVSCSIWFGRNKCVQGVI